MKNLKVLAVTLVAATAVFANAQTGTNPALKQDIQKLITDVKADVAGSQVTLQEIQALQAELLLVAETAHKPNPAYVADLKATLIAVYQSGTVTQADKATIAKEVSEILESAGITQAEATALENDLLAIWYSSNLTKAELQELAADLKAIVRDLPNPPSNP